MATRLYLRAISARPEPVFHNAIAAYYTGLGLMFKLYLIQGRTNHFRCARSASLFTTSSFSVHPLYLDTYWGCRR